MRSYATAKPTYWNGTTGRLLRAAGANCQLLGLYLITNPHANAIGLYYLPFVNIQHEVSLPPDQIRSALDKLSHLDYAHYDEPTEIVWVVTMAEHQLGDLKAGDRRSGPVLRVYSEIAENPHLGPFFDRYGVSLRLQQRRSVTPICDVSLTQRRPDQLSVDVSPTQRSTDTSRANTDTADGAEIRGPSETCMPLDPVPVPVQPPAPSQFREGLETPLRVVSQRAIERDLPAAPFDVWVRQLIASYPQQSVTSGHSTEYAFIDAFRRELPRPPTDVWAEMQANLQNQKQGHQWRVKRMIAKLDRWLRDGLWKQQHDAEPPADSSGHKPNVREVNATRLRAALRRGAG